MQAARSSRRALRFLSCPRCLARSVSTSSSTTHLVGSVSNRQTSNTPSSFKQARREINTISPEEVSHFSSLSQTWWNERGDFNVLQRMNKVRVEFLKERLKMVKRYEDGVTLQDLKNIEGPFPLKGMKVIDVGCGGGLFSEVRS